MSHSMDFQGQIASIMEVLANAAVAEICKVVDDGYAVVQLEMSQNHKENEFLKRKIKLMELQIAKLRAERRCQDGTFLNRFHGVQLLNRQNRERANSAAGLTVKSRFRNWDVRTNTPPTEAPVEKSPHVIASSKVGSDDMEEGEPDLLIIKEEKPEEPKPLDQEAEESGRCLESAYDVDDDAPFLPSAVPVEPRTRHADVEDKVLDDRKTITKPVKQENTEETIGISEGSDKPGISAEVFHVVEVNIPDKAVKPESRKDGMRQKPQLAGSRNFRAQKSQRNHSEWPSCSTRPSLDHSSFHVSSRLGHVHGTMGELSPGRPDEKPDVIIIDPSTVNEEQNTQSQWHSDIQMQRANKQPEFCRQEYADKDMQGLRDQSQSHSQKKGGNVFESESYSMDMNTLGSYNMCVGLDNSSGESQGQQLPWVLSDSEDNATSATVPSQRRSRSFCCTLCGKRYMTVKQLKVHQKIHAGEKPYCCIQCGKRFIQLYSLKRHHRVHTGEKPFRCGQCGKQFAHSSNLKVHQTVHTGEKNFHCAQCGKNFSFLSNLIRHQAIHVAK
ncbi:zinc finger protein 483-like isoform X3 [Alosa alosa]|uniref:zinc finger protein 483-like isoform X3 n=1 Tax=Alosa alosa TaxID=278164 RepID=UPI0020151263|nr:zinc finger protein 483-like isoform X3 [Alosa alosa]